MTTINQLVRKKRAKKVRKGKSPVLNVGFNSMERKATDTKYINTKVYKLDEFIKKLKND